MAKIYPCPKCRFRAKYDNNPGSLLGRLWRWHANWCPGWNGYFNSLPEREQLEIAEKYNMQNKLKKM